MAHKLVYYDKATGEVRATKFDAFRHIAEHEDEEVRNTHDQVAQADADNMFGEDVCGVSRIDLDEDELPLVGETWDAATNTVTAPRPDPPAKAKHPQADRVKAIRDGWGGDYSKATVAELAELLDASGILARIIGE